MRDFIRSTFTSADNKSGDIGRIAFAALVLAFIADSSYSLVTGKPFDAGAWATAAGVLSVGLSGSLLVKHITEPKQ